MDEGRHSRTMRVSFCITPFSWVSSNFLPALIHSRGGHGGGIFTAILKVFVTGLRGSVGSCMLVVGHDCNLT